MHDINLKVVRQYKGSCEVVLTVQCLKERYTAKLGSYVREYSVTTKVQYRDKRRYHIIK